MTDITNRQVKPFCSFIEDMKTKEFDKTMFDLIKTPKTPEPSSISSYKKYGITRQNLNYLMTHFHTFPHEFKDCLEKYYLLYWSAKYFQEQLHEGKITHDNITYDVTYLGCTPENIKLCDGNQIKISFRLAMPEFNLRPVVVISVRKEIIS